MSLKSDIKKIRAAVEPERPALVIKIWECGCPPPCDCVPPEGVIVLRFPGDEGPPPEGACRHRYFHSCRLCHKGTPLEDPHGINKGANP